MSNKLPATGKKMLFKKISVVPLTAGRWDDFERLFGSKGACGGCWCMYWRLKRAEFIRSKGEGNKKHFKKIVYKQQPAPGLLLYAGNEPAGWCALAPRSEYPVLNHSRILKPVDDQLVWSIVCFFIDKNFRRMGLTEIFLEYALKFCKNEGAEIVEGYPVDVKDNEEYPEVFAYTGIASAYLKAGFTEVARRSPKRPVMRYVFRGQAERSG